MFALQGNNEGSKMQVNAVHPYRVEVDRVYDNIPFFNGTNNIVVGKYLAFVL